MPYLQKLAGTEACAPREFALPFSAGAIIFHMSYAI
jgi:hypothetical protein